MQRYRHAVAAHTRTHTDTHTYTHTYTHTRIRTILKSSDPCAETKAEVSATTAILTAYSVCLRQDQGSITIAGAGDPDVNGIFRIVSPGNANRGVINTAKLYYVLTGSTSSLTGLIDLYSHKNFTGFWYISKNGTLNVCTYVHMHAYILYVLLGTCIHTYIHTYKYIHTYIHTYIHKCINTNIHTCYIFLYDQCKCVFVE